MTSYKIGDVVLVEFPFSNQESRKRRPALVLLSEGADLLAARVTTRPPRDPSDVALSHWAEIGLPRASTVCLTKLATIDHHLVLRTIGRLHPDDGRIIAQAWQHVVAIIVTELQA